MPCQKSVDECVAVVSGSGVYDEACGLIYDHEVVILVENFQRKVGCNRSVKRRKFGSLEEVTQRDFLFSAVDTLLIKGNEAGLDERLCM